MELTHPVVYDGPSVVATLVSYAACNEWRTLVKLNARRVRAFSL